MSPSCEPPLLSSYAQPRLARSLLDIATSAVLYIALMVVMFLTVNSSYLPTLLLSVPAAGLLVRTFIVFHDCGHGSLFSSKRANRYVGRVFGLLLVQPFTQWRQEHAVHHGTSGDLERRGIGDLPTLTVSEYEARSWRGRLGYRLFRNPLVMFGLGPIAAMIVGPRFVSHSWRPRFRNSVLATDCVLFAMAAGLCWLVGWERLLIVWAPSALLAGSVGIWLFYVQHQFEDAYWTHSGEWSYAEAALKGSSYLRLPRVLQFFTGNIGLHHVHHLNPRVPNYNLQRAHDENAIFQQVPTLSLLDGLRTVRLKLWDEERGALVTFAQARSAPEARHAPATRTSAVPLGDAGAQEGL
jgi:acyl-lipid omega-6 desaturase (Delta-12 desaturase)